MWRSSCAFNLTDFIWFYFWIWESNSLFLWTFGNSTSKCNDGLVIVDDKFEPWMAGCASIRGFAKRGGAHNCNTRSNCARKTSMDSGGCAWHVSLLSLCKVNFVVNYANSSSTKSKTNLFAEGVSHCKDNNTTIDCFLVPLVMVPLFNIRVGFGWISSNERMPCGSISRIALY